VLPATIANNVSAVATVMRRCVFVVMETLTYFLEMRMTLPFGLTSRASECNVPSRWMSNLVGIACWASFAG
jgi:hypothetical protein